ncbi:MAG: thioredoxin domain-containing protein [Myxococcota bacterium]|nr:thioredoxin domain-containing protein [Myxococcota bacterium]
MKSNDIVARYADQEIKLSEIDGLLADSLCKAKIEYDKKVNELRKELVDELITRRLLALEAKKQGKSGIDELLMAELKATMKDPDEAMLKAEYDRVKDRLEGVTFDAVKEKIREFLTQQERQKATMAYFEKLKTVHKVSTNLPVYRVKVKTDGPSKGPADAKVVILEFADFECPYCVRGNDTLNELLKKYPKDVRVVFKDFPLDFHQNAVPAAVGVRCAGTQQKYWQMHAKMFENYDSLSPEKINELAAGIGLDMKAFSTCIADPKHAEGVKADQEEGASYGVEGTPAFFVNGIPLSGAQPLSAFAELVEKELKRQAKK